MAKFGTSQNWQTALKLQLLSPGSSEGSATTMTTPPVNVERRIGQRFPFNLPVSMREISTAAEGLGFTQDLSSRGVFLFTDMALSEGAEIELTLKMPSEITLGENMPVRCRGSVLRVVKPAQNGWKAVLSVAAANTSPDLKSAEATHEKARSEETRSEETKIGVAVRLKDYEYLPDSENESSAFRRISALHSPSQVERPSPSPGTPRTVGG
jgi:hypothetical protein